MRKPLAIATATLVLAASAGFTAATADRPDTRVRLAVLGAPLPQDPPPAAGVPTPGQVADILTGLTDPHIGYQDKIGLVQGGLSPEDGESLDQQLSRFDAHHELPYTFAVSDIQPAPGDLAGATIAITGPRVHHPQILPIALVNQGGNWALLPDSETQVLQRLTKNDAILSGGGGFTNPPIMPMMPGRFGF